MIEDNICNITYSTYSIIPWKNAKAYEIISYIFFNYYVYLFQKIEISFFHLESENAEGVNGTISKRMFHKINKLLN